VIIYGRTAATVESRVSGAKEPDNHRALGIDCAVGADGALLIIHHTTEPAAVQM
jgi:hypothetical protein